MIGKGFGKNKKASQNKTTQLIMLISKIQQLEIGDKDLLEEIKADVQEGIPLSEHKKDHLRIATAKLKEKTKNDKLTQEKSIDESTSQNTNESNQSNHKNDKKTKFSLFAKLKRKKSESNPSIINSVDDKIEARIITDESSAEIIESYDTLDDSKDTKYTKAAESQNHTDALENNTSNSKIPDTLQSMPKIIKNNLSSKTIDEKIDSKIIPDILSNQKSSDSLIDIQESTISYDKELESKYKADSWDDEVPKTEQTFKIQNDTLDKEKTINNPSIFSTIDPNSSHETFLEEEENKTSIEFAELSENYKNTKEMELKEIKTIIEDINSKKSALQSDIGKIKTLYNPTELSERYQKLIDSLDTATSGLYGVQSEVYHRLRDIRKLKTELKYLKDELLSIQFNNDLLRKNLIPRNQRST